MFWTIFIGALAVAAAIALVYIIVIIAFFLIAWWSVR